MTVSSTTRAIGREWALAKRDPRVPAVLFVAGLLTVLALLAGDQRVERRLDRERAIERENSTQRRDLESAFDDAAAPSDGGAELSPAEQDRRAALRMAARSPDLMRFTGGLWTSYRPASPLSRLTAGTADDWPDAYRHAGSSLAETLRRDAPTNPLLTVVGPYDTTLLVGAVLPLLLLMLTFDLTADDRERGRWPLVASHCGSTAALVALRCGVRVAAVAVVVILPTVLWTLAVPAGEAPSVAALAVWCGAVLGTLACWGALAFLVASFDLSAAASGLTLLLCWAVLVLGVPSLIERRVNDRAAPPEPGELAAVERRADEQFLDLPENVWRDFLRRHPEVELDDENPQLEFLLQDLAAAGAVRDRVLEAHRAEIDRFLARERRLDRLQFLSPAVAWRTASEQAAGTSLRHAVDLASATAEFHGAFQKHFEPMTITDRELTRDDIRAMPAFDGRTVGPHMHAAPLALSGAALLLWTAACGLIGWLRFRRRDPFAHSRPSRKAD
ncbi:DUF3526 domain-containing protein [Alienimonas californiensis]|uniref:ABC-2 family transporter protein n=1 Tax=Alienimonas californiensis TaxID=2527989 RepID=A0A517P5S7_9PLAN|nr:DUF3526 domain-containing protein [Alienimonas californiensis]QDT14738.1 ABC-2 family transporter protein [Alienimonas californiensis]